MARPRKTRSTEGYNKTTLGNGLRVVTEFMPSMRSVALGVWVDVGSRNETLPENGVSHLVEHMLFKGTQRRNARQLAAAIENLGGVLNAFTSREQTCYTARILDAHLETAIDVLADQTCNSTLTPLHLSREKQVIVEEIKESVDNPSDRVHDLFAAAYWGDHSLGRPILGTAENIVNMSRSVVRDYVARQYRAGSVVVSAAGSVKHDDLVNLVKKYFTFGDGNAVAPEPAARRSEQQVSIHGDNKSAQTHVVIGWPGLAYNDNKKMAALALNNYLGGGMSSVLFQKIREDKGLAYSVYTYHDFYRDSGIVGAYVATDGTHLAEATSIILEETDKLKRRRLPKSRVDEIKEQLKGHLTLSMESTTSHMNRMARQELMMGEYQSLAEILKQIDAVTPSDILELANLMFNRSAVTITALGPVKKNALDHVV